MYAKDLSEDSDDVEVDTVFNEDGFSFADPKLAQHITLLRRVGILRLKSVLVDHHSGSRVDLLDASSGELSILVSFFGLAANIRDDSMILIDEPELSLHPEWQRRYLYLLDKAFSYYKNCHFILATHSPIIVLDFPKSISHLISLDKDAVSDINDLSGQSSDYILANAFGIISKKNYYVRDLIAKCLKYASTGDYQNADYLSAFDRLKQLRDLMREDNVFIGVIDALERGAASYAEQAK
jgi:predicted ATP-binding protein involved in virulence